MAQIIDPTPIDDKNVFSCCYVNASNQIQVARITNIPNWYFERVVFPGQRLIFESVPNGLLEIHTGMMASAILSDTIPCERLAINMDLTVSNNNNNNNHQFVTKNIEKTENQEKQFLKLDNSKKKNNSESSKTVLI